MLVHLWVRRAWQWHKCTEIAPPKPKLVSGDTGLMRTLFWVNLSKAVHLYFPVQKVPNVQAWSSVLLEPCRKATCRCNRKVSKWSCNSSKGIWRGVEILISNTCWRPSRFAIPLIIDARQIVFPQVQSLWSKWVWNTKNGLSIWSTRCRPVFNALCHFRVCQAGAIYWQFRTFRSFPEQVWLGMRRVLYTSAEWPARHSFLCSNFMACPDMSGELAAPGIQWS